MKIYLFQGWIMTTLKKIQNQGSLCHKKRDI